MSTLLWKNTVFIWKSTHLKLAPTLKAKKINNRPSLNKHPPLTPTFQPFLKNIFVLAQGEVIGFQLNSLVEQM